MGLVHAGMAQHGMVVFAHSQTKGKGQRQKTWLSSPNENITLSLIIKPFGLLIQQQFLLSMCVALAVRNFFSSYAGDETKIKWPNDIYWCDRKAAGILIENALQGNEWKFAVIGIGVNLNQTQFENFQHRAVSLKQITGKTFDTVSMAKEILTHLDTAFEKLKQNAQAVISDYHEQLYKWKEKVVLKKQEEQFPAIIDRVDEEGKLHVRHAEDHRQENFRVGEIEWVFNPVK